MQAFLIFLEFSYPQNPKMCDPILVMHFSIEIPTPPPPPRAKVGKCGGFLWYLKARCALWGGGFLRICFTHSSRVGIGLVPSFRTVISSRGHWCRSLDFDGPRFAVLFRHLVLKGKFSNYFSTWMMSSLYGT